MEDHDVSPDRPQSPMATGVTSPPHKTQEDEAMHEWSAFYDADGRLYYYNNSTGESSWEEPDKYNPPPDTELAAEDGAERASDGAGQEQHDEKDEPKQSEGVGEGDFEGVTAAGPWSVHQDDEGREYFYNEETGLTQWERPEDFDSLTSSAEAEAKPSTPEKSVSPVRTSTDVEEDKTAATNDMETKDTVIEEEPLEEIDPAVKKLEAAEKALNEPDAIMEPSCWSNVWALVESLGQAEGGKKAMQALVASFHGETAICGLLTNWLAELRSASSSNSSKDATQQHSISDSAANGTRDIVQDVLNRIAKERFTKTGGDNILNLDKKAASFLEEMMDSPKWRKLLIDLSASNKDSALLMYCLESISKRGHHREIAKRNNQSDHFAVYNAMLASEFAVVGKSAVSFRGDEEVGMGLDGLVTDLRRTCTSTSYTYLYAIEVLRDLISTSEDTNDPDNIAVPRLHRSTRKWERLREELEDAMVDPSVSSTGTSALFRKRRLDVALTITDLYQNQRRRRKPSPDDMAVDQTNGGFKYADSLESALLNLLRRHYVGTRVDDRILNQLLQKETNLGAGGEVGRLLVSHPLSIKVLLGCLFKPGASRMGTLQTKQKCARLIALAAIAAQKNEVDNTSKQEQDSLGQPVGLDEVSLTETILSGSQLCSKVENMVSFTVSSEAVSSGDDSSPGRTLSSCAMKNASVAQGVVIWATEIARGPEFVSSASYPTLTPSLLSLLRLICLQHPFTRRPILDVCFIFLKHSNSEISYQKMNEIKEQALRLLLFLLVKGEVTVVLGEISRRLRQQGNSEIDASLVRYFFGGLLDIVRPPYSLPFVRSLGQLLSAPRCAEALKSSYFSQPNKKRLVSVIESFNNTLKLSQGTKEDSTLVTSLVSVYA